MANDFYTPEQAAKVAVALAKDDALVSALISRDLEDDLLGGGGKGRTVNVKVPTALVARARGVDDVTNSIVMDSLSETTVAITLGVHAYNAVGLSEGDLSLDLTNFSGQVLAPQVAAVVSYIEDSVIAKMQAEPDDATVTWDATNPVKAFTAIRKILRKRGVPAENLNVLCGVDVYAALLDANLIQDASQSGSTAALRDAQIGRLRGFNVLESTKIADGDIIAFHRNAYTLAVRAPKKPEGAAFGASLQGEGGFALRYLRDYDADKTQDRSIISTFCGVEKMPLYKVTRTQQTLLQGDVDTDTTGPDLAMVLGTATVTQVAAGAVVRVATV